MRNFRLPIDSKVSFTGRALGQLCRSLKVISRVWHFRFSFFKFDLDLLAFIQKRDFSLFLVNINSYERLPDFFNCIYWTLFNPRPYKSSFYFYFSDSSNKINSPFRKCHLKFTVDVGKLASQMGRTSKKINKAVPRFVPPRKEAAPWGHMKTWHPPTAPWTPISSLGFQIAVARQHLNCWTLICYSLSFILNALHCV